MQMKEFEGATLKECLQQVRSELGSEAVILETRKIRKGGLMGIGVRDAVAIIAATGISVDSDSVLEPGVRAPELQIEAGPSDATPAVIAASQNRAPQSTTVPQRSSSPAVVAARGVYGRKRPLTSEGAAWRDELAIGVDSIRSTVETDLVNRGSARESRRVLEAAQNLTEKSEWLPGPLSNSSVSTPPDSSTISSLPASDAPQNGREANRLVYLEQAMGDIRERLVALQLEQRAGNERTVSAVVTAVAPAVSAVHAAGFATQADELQPRFPTILDRLRGVGVEEQLIEELMDQLPDMSAWSEQAREALALSAVKDLMSRRVAASGAIRLTPGAPKVVALVGPTGVGKTTTIAKLAAHFALMQGKRVGLITVDTYRIAAVEQLKTYAQIIGIPVNVAYSPSEIPPILELYSDCDLVLIDTAGRSQQHASQLEELKELLGAIECEVHLVLSAATNETDLMEIAVRFAAARVDRLIFSKLDETSRVGSLLNVADKTGIPLSYFAIGQNVPEDLEAADGARLAARILG